MYRFVSATRRRRGFARIRLADEYLTYAREAQRKRRFEMKRADERGHGVIAKIVCLLAEILERQKARPDISKTDHILEAAIFKARSSLPWREDLRAGEGKGTGREIPPSGCCRIIRD